MEDWKEVIFNKIKQRKGAPVALKEIYQLMKTHTLVTPYHLKPWRLGGQPRYECWIRRCLTSLIRENRVKRISRALYASK